MSELSERLRARAKIASDIMRQMAEAKSLRQSDNIAARTDLYMWPKPEQTDEGRAADALDAAEEVLREARISVQYHADDYDVVVLQEGGDNPPAKLLAKIDAALNNIRIPKGK